MMGLTALRRNKLPSDHEVSTLALLLVLGTFAIVPIGSVLLVNLGFSLTVSSLAILAIVGGLYGFYAFYIDRLLLSSLIATVVLSTLAANVPLSLGRYPDNLAQIMLFHVPLVVTLGLLLSSGAYKRRSWSWLELLFAGFVGWSVLAAIFGAGPRLDVGLFFAVFMAIVGLFLSAIYRSVATQVIALRQLLAVFVVTVAGQSMFALAQLLNQHGFGLTVLGEVHRYSEANTLAIPFLRDPFIGVFISGLTGGNGPLGQLLTVALPVTITLAMSERSRTRYPIYALVILEMFLLRATAKDAGRAAVLLSLFSLVGGFGLAWYFSEWEIDRDVIDRYWMQLTAYAVLGAGLIYLTLLSSEGTTTTDKSGGGGTQQTATSTPGESATTGSGFDPSGVHVPFFDTGSLGIRFQQYVAGIHMAVQHPIFGIGGANYPYVAPAYGLPKFLKGNLFPLHSLFIALLAETGIPGFLLYTMAVGVAVWAGWKLLGTDISLIAVGVLAALIGWAAIAFWTVAVRYTMVLPVWILAAGIVGELHRRRDTPT